jgi:hypothetical protein
MQHFWPGYHVHDLIIFSKQYRDPRNQQINQFLLVLILSVFGYNIMSNNGLNTLGDFDILYFDSKS